MRTKSTRLGAVLVVALASLTAGAPDASATVTVTEGVQTPVGADHACSLAEPGAFATYWMDGSLVGCWYLDDFVVRGAHASGTFQATGAEHFVGCLDRSGDGSCSAGDPSGTLWFRFVFTAKYDAATFTQEIHGRCHHPVVAGSGGFAGAKGQISFTDDVATGAAPYWGPLSV